MDDHRRFGYPSFQDKFPIPCHTQNLTAASRLLTHFSNASFIRQSACGCLCQEEAFLCLTCLALFNALAQARSNSDFSREREGRVWAPEKCWPPPPHPLPRRSLGIKVMGKKKEEEEEGEKEEEEEEEENLVINCGPAARCPLPRPQGAQPQPLRNLRALSVCRILMSVSTGVCVCYACSYRCI